MKQHDVSNSERVEAALRELRDELAGVESVRAQVAARIAETSDGRAGVRSGAGVALLVVAASFILVALAAVVLLHRHHRPPPIPVVVRDPTGLPAAEPFKLDVGDAEVEEHLAAVLDGGQTVLVVWSCRGAGVAPEPAEAGSSGPYRHRLLKREKRGDGRTFAFSSFTAGRDVRPVLEPPSIRLQSGGGGLIAVRVSPRVSSTAGLAAALRAPPLSLTDAGVEEILRAADANSSK
jgi:hypothetical protein